MFLAYLRRFGIAAVLTLGLAVAGGVRVGAIGSVHADVCMGGGCPEAPNPGHGLPFRFR